MIESYLREILKEKSITQEELSKMTGIRLATISFIALINGDIFLKII